MIDDKFKSLGFYKTNDNKYGITYEKDKDSYVHVISIRRRKNGFIIHSYQKDVNLEQFNNVVGLSDYEFKLIYRKINEIKIKRLIQKIKLGVLKNG